MSYTPEPIPQNNIISQLSDNWVQYAEIPLPIFIEVNFDEPNYPRLDLNKGDYIVVKQDVSGMNVRYRGNYQYYDRVFPLVLEITTRHSRQRLYDIMATIRRIAFTKKHDITNNGYQLIRFGGFWESVTSEQKIWRGQIKITFEDLGKTADTI